MLTANEIRSQYLNFFASKGHAVIASDSVVPKEDPTVLFTTAGMQQFKRQFLGFLDTYTRATSSQKCIRTDDLDKVGHTAFHHTFFEMLGNFSFGDYFKKEAILWAWEFLTKIIGLPEDKLWVSVYQEDTEAAKIWREDIRFPKDKLVRLGANSNFWPANAQENGPNGPCGPCSEIFYDYGVNDKCPRGDKCDPSCDCGRFSEIWNLVFTQFDRQDGGVLKPLPAKNIDTGMGLERLTAVLQGKKNNFETDLFTPILEAIEREMKNEKISCTQREKFIIADHIRAIVFAISDGVIPSNKERGFVIKRLITDLTDILLQKQGKPFLHRLVPVVVDVMKEPYPELIKKMNEISLYIEKTQEDYESVFKNRIPELYKEIKKISGLPAQQRREFLGQTAFNYRDRFGLTLQTIMTVMQQNSISAEDMEAAKQQFQLLMEKQQERSRASSKMTGDVFTTPLAHLNIDKTEFAGHDLFQCEGRIIKLLKENTAVESVGPGETVKIIVDRTPFYAEAGGQVGDTGWIQGNKGKMRVEDTQKIEDVFLHIGQITEGQLFLNDFVKLQIDEERRLAIMRNHTATHLLQAALREILGSHVQQQGSLVEEKGFRFDFSHPQAVTEEQLTQIEDYVNARILSCSAVAKNEMPITDAKSSGALAFFAEKYGQQVRVVSISEYSKEFCGGTHLMSTGQVGLFKIINESAIAQGIRRIEATTGFHALRIMHEKETVLKRLGKTLKVSPELIPERVDGLLARQKLLEKETDKLRFETIKGTIDKIIQQAESIEGTKIITHAFQGIEIETLRKISDLLKQKAPSSAIVLGSQTSENAYLLATVSDDLIKKNIKADSVIQEISPIIGGSGGGRAQMAQAGSKEPAKLHDALQKANLLIRNKLGL